MIILVSYGIFSYHDKAYEIPDIAWAVILGPWLGEGATKLKNILKGARGGKL
jgi:hypothetical protein